MHISTEDDIKHSVAQYICNQLSYKNIDYVKEVGEIDIGGYRADIVINTSYGDIAVECKYGGDIRKAIGQASTYRVNGYIPGVGVPSHISDELIDAILLSDIRVFVVGEYNDITEYSPDSVDNDIFFQSYMNKIDELEHQIDDLEEKIEALKNDERVYEYIDY